VYELVCSLYCWVSVGASVRASYAQWAHPGLELSVGLCGCLLVGFSARVMVLEGMLVPLPTMRPSCKHVLVEAVVPRRALALGLCVLHSVQNENKTTATGCRVTMAAMSSTTTNRYLGTRFP